MATEYARMDEETLFKRVRPASHVLLCSLTIQWHYKERIALKEKIEESQRETEVLQCSMIQLLMVCRIRLDRRR